MKHVDLPAAFVESTIEASARAASDFLKEGIALVRRGDEDDGLRDLGRAHQLVDHIVELCERPRNTESGRQVCSVCGAEDIMPNGRCIEHGGE